MNKEKNFVSSVVYVHNAEERIAEFLNIVLNVMEENFEYSEIICVNDSSDDRSVEQIKICDLASTSVSISVVNMSYFHGVEVAMNAGVDLAIGDFVFEFDDTELDFNKEEIMKVYRKSVEEGYDIVSASPDKKERCTSRFFYKVFDRFTGLSYKMNTERFRILSRRSINRIGSMNRAILYRKAAYVNCGLKSANVRYSVVKPTYILKDKKEKKYRLGLAIDSCILYTEIGYRFSMAMTLLMMFISTFMVAYSIIVFFTAHPVAGWTTTILFLAVAFFGLFGSLTMIIKYLQILLNLNFKRTHYSFESIEKLGNNVARGEGL